MLFSSPGSKQQGIYYIKLNRLWNLGWLRKTTLCWVSRNNFGGATEKIPEPQNIGWSQNMVAITTEPMRTMPLSPPSASKIVSLPGLYLKWYNFVVSPYLWLYLKGRTWIKWLQICSIVERKQLRNRGFSLSICVFRSFVKGPKCILETIKM